MKYMTITLPGGEVWGVPVDMIARDRAGHYATEFDGDIERSLKEDTLPLFADDEYEIEDWAVNNMNWSDFDGHQIKISDGGEHDFQGAWMDAEKGFAEVKDLRKPSTGT